MSVRSDFKYDVLQYKQVMIMNYPNRKIKRKRRNKTTANRGMNLESAINDTNQFYIDNDVAYIYKKPIPIQVVNVDYKKRSAAKIVEAYYQVPSTTDYNGIYKGKYIDFEAKETKNKTSFPLKNIHDHQVEHLVNVKRHGGISFIIVYFSTLDETFLLLSKHLKRFYDRAKTGRKSITYNEFVSYGYRIEEGYRKRLDFLSIIDDLLKLE